MSGEADFSVRAEPDNFKNTLFLAMELSPRDVARGDVRTAAR